MQGIVTRSLGLGCGLLVLCGLGACSTKAKDWSFRDSQGAIRSLSDYQGQVVVIGFSNTWCEPCREAAPHLQALQDRFGPEGVKILSVSAWERGSPEKWMAEHGFTYGLMLNGTKVARDHDVDRVPTFMVVGIDGKVIYRHEGFSESTPDKIARVVEKHLAKHGHDTFAQGG